MIRIVIIPMINEKVKSLIQSIKGVLKPLNPQITTPPINLT